MLDVLSCNPSSVYGSIIAVKALLPATLMQSDKMSDHQRLNCLAHLEA